MKKYYPTFLVIALTISVSFLAKFNGQASSAGMKIFDSDSDSDESATCLTMEMNVDSNAITYTQADVGCGRCTYWKVYTDPQTNQTIYYEEELWPTATSVSCTPDPETHEYCLPVIVAGSAICPAGETPPEDSDSDSDSDSDE